MSTVLVPCVVSCPVPLSVLAPVTLKAPLRVSAPAPPSVPLLSSIVGAAIVNGLLTLTVAPPTSSVPRPEKLTPVLRLRVPPEKFSVVPAATA